MRGRTKALVGSGVAFVAAGTAATLFSERVSARRHRRFLEEVPFGSVHGESRWVTARDGVRLHVEVDEADEPDAPTVVMVHGWTCDLDTWHYQRLALRGRARLVLVDLRSHGASGRARAVHSTLPDLADDLARVIDEVAPTGPLVLVGHSMGGMTVMQLAADDPGLVKERVKGVVLLSTSAGDLLRTSPLLRQLRPLLRATTPAVDWARRFNSYSVTRRWAVGPDADEKYADMADQMIGRARTHVMLDFYPAFGELDLYDALPALGTAEVVVVCGTEDLLTPPRHARRLAEEIPGARLELVDGAGHMIMFEEHARVTEAIETVVDHVAEGGRA
jgi:pimeloyl-ACP methyl ester carboxylesterase